MQQKTGIFYGVGVGPGDPELLTLKAVRVLEQCSVIAAPQTKSGEMLALRIAEQSVDFCEKTILPLQFTMARDVEQQAQAHRIAAQAVEAYLAAGQDVAMLNLGDVSIYATYGYLMELLQAKGYQTVMVPGVPSFCAVAARLGTSLTSIDKPLHIIPAGDENLERTLALSGTKVLMKAGKRIPKVIAALEEQNALDQASMVQNCGLENEIVYRNLQELKASAGYFATIVVKE
ncbi:MAG: precorrin-2 C(20)-methyltransferase [Oscillospiraceae bacterium]|jgi:precorrin-2/cobalt-factor-2 C20-methyltransferase